MKWKPGRNNNRRASLQDTVLQGSKSISSAHTSPSASLNSRSTFPTGRANTGCCVEFTKTGVQHRPRERGHLVRRGHTHTHTHTHLSYTALLNGQIHVQVRKASFFWRAEQRPAFCRKQRTHRDFFSDAKSEPRSKARISRALG